MSTLFKPAHTPRGLVLPFWPIPAPLTVVCGPPIPVAKTESPTPEQVGGRAGACVCVCWGGGAWLGSCFHKPTGRRLWGILLRFDLVCTNRQTGACACACGGGALCLDLVCTNQQDAASLQRYTTFTGRRPPAAVHPCLDGALRPAQGAVRGPPPRRRAGRAMTFLCFCVAIGWLWCACGVMTFLCGDRRCCTGWLAVVCVRRGLVMSSMELRRKDLCKNGGGRPPRLA